MPLSDVWLARFDHTPSYNVGPLLLRAACLSFPYEEVLGDVPGAAWLKIGDLPSNDSCAPGEVGVVYFDETPCGNGVQEPWEECDDGNQLDADGCDHECKFTFVTCSVSADTIRPGTVVSVRMQATVLDPNAFLEPPQLEVTFNSQEGQPTPDLALSTPVSTLTTDVTTRFYAKHDVDVLNGKLTGRHLGGATCSVTANTSIPLPAPKGKGLDFDFGSAGIVVGVAGVACAVAEPCGAAAGLVLGGTGLVLGAADKVSGDLQKDPPDLNFTEFATPAFQSFTPLPIGPGIDAATAAAINTFLSQASQIRGYGEALLTTMNRATGALVAGDNLWKARQLQAAAPLRKALAALFAQTARQSFIVSRSLSNAGFAPLTITADQMALLQGEVRQNGLPLAFRQVLTDLGADQSQLDYIRARIQDADTASGEGTFPDVLADADQLKPLLWQAAQLGAPQKHLCYQAKNANPTESPASLEAEVGDKFNDAATVKLTKVIGECNPVNVYGVDDDLTAPYDTVGHLTKYAIRPTQSLTSAKAVSVNVENAYHSLSLTLNARKPAWLMVPSAVAVGGGGTIEDPSPFSDALLCYKVRLESPRGAAYSAPGSGEQYQDILGGPVTTRQSMPSLLCSPANVNGSDPGAREHPGHLLCYKTAGKSGFGASPQLSRNDEFGAGVLQLARVDTFCVPTLVESPTP